ncbi:MAG: DUF6311 domain-containing protein [Pseudochelatococcus sp.]|jgi:hypothetical protein|uniref:DUF6311 domain-containing protein n=1 Tax=Pseudochelatococcus sp. TaxID=2020869 RepID=UPI003D8F6727
MFSKMIPTGGASGPAGLVLSALFGFAFAFYLTPEGYIAGTAGYWQNQIEDIAQYQSGFTAYLHAPWGWPLLSIPSLDWPHGTVVTFVDAIPVMALTLKAAALVVPVPENPFGYWLLFCYMMQGVAAWFAISQIRPGNWAALGLAVFFCVLMPSLAARMGHLALQAHFLLIFALGLYFRSMRRERALIVGWSLLLAASFYIHLYLAAMVAAVLLACALDLFRRTRRGATLAAHAIPIAVLLLTFPPMLGTSLGNAVQNDGFGYYSMNLLAPLINLPTDWLGTTGQYEGYNYLGPGLIALIAVALFSRPAASESRPLFGRYLILALLACFLYALSNKIYAGTLKVASWPQPAFLVPIFGTFRSSGRMFWIVSYALVFFAVARTTAAVQARTLLGFAVVVALQAAVLNPDFAGVREALRRPPFTPADPVAWRAALDGVKTMHVFPKFLCNAWSREILPLQVIAAGGGYNITTGSIARYSADCDATAAEIAASDPDTAAYVFVREKFSDEEIRAYVPHRARCGQLDIWVVCRKEQPAG